MSEPEAKGSWSTYQQSSLDLRISIPLNEVFEAMRSEGASIIKTIIVEGERFDVYIMSLGKADPEVQET